MQFSTVQQITEIRISNCAAALETIQKEWNELFDKWTEESFDEFFNSDIYEAIYRYFADRDYDTEYDWDGDDLVLGVKNVYDEQIEHFQKKLAEISNCLPLLQIGKFTLDNENGYPEIHCYDQDNDWVGSVRFQQDDEDDDEDDESEVAETRTSQGNDFVDIFDPQPTISLAPITEPTTSEEAALAALKWLGEKFNVPTHDER